RTMTGMPARASRTPSIIPAGPPPAMQQRVSSVMSATDRFQRAFEVARGVIIIRLQRQRGAELRDGVINLLLADERQSEPVMGGGIVRRQACGLARVKDRTVEIVLLQVLQRKISLRQSVLRIDRDRALKRIQR